jgi:hypothetical protein
VVLGAVVIVVSKKKKKEDEDPKGVLKHFLLFLVVRTSPMLKGFKDLLTKVEQR